MSSSIDLDSIRRRVEMRRLYGKTVPVDADDLDALLRYIEALEANTMPPMPDSRSTASTLPPTSTEARIERARTVAWLRAMAAQWETHADLVGTGLAQVWQTIATLLENREPERWTQELHELHEED